MTVKRHKPKHTAAEKSNAVILFSYDLLCVRATKAKTKRNYIISHVFCYFYHSFLAPVFSCVLLGISWNAVGFTSALEKKMGKKPNDNIRNRLEWWKSKGESECKSGKENSKEHFK